jgi:pyrophosphate--fructose-6-phosphate 1-phosphotransferase
MADFAGKHVNVAMLTAGGLAPCLSSSIAQLSLSWMKALKEGKITGLTLRFYKAGYKGLLTGDSFVLDEKEWDGVDSLNYLGGSPIGNSRVKVRKNNNLLAHGHQLLCSVPNNIYCASTIICTS